VSGVVKERRRWLVAAAVAAAVVAGSRVRRSARRDCVPADSPADVGFMRALHSALRRDLSRLQAVASQLDGSTPAPPTVLVGWDGFRSQLDNHHAAEDDDLWPVLRPKLTDPAELAPSTRWSQSTGTSRPCWPTSMPPCAGGELTTPVERLSTVVRDHLDHEEREVLPLLERHLTRAEWRAFLLTERGRRSPRERPEFLTWILDDATEEDAAAVLAELPPPARLVYRRVLRPRYAAQHRWQISRS
jgi:hypothetical protein